MEKTTNIEDIHEHELKLKVMKKVWKCSYKKATNNDHFDEQMNLAYICDRWSVKVCGLCVVKSIWKVPGTKFTPIEWENREPVPEQPEENKSKGFVPLTAEEIGK